MKRLFRSSRDKKIAGVCAGLGEYLGVDPVVIRAAFIISLFFGGIGILIYLVLWIISPIDENGVRS